MVCFLKPSHAFNLEKKVDIDNEPFLSCKVLELGHLKLFKVRPNAVQIYTLSPAVSDTESVNLYCVRPDLKGPRSKTCTDFLFTGLKCQLSILS